MSSDNRSEQRYLPTVIADRDGHTIRDAVRLALCRCGQSSNKPFCDTTHRRIDFRGNDATPEEGEGA